MKRIILLFFIWAFAIPAHSNPYENVWYRWNTFQDSVDEKAMYLRCGHIFKSPKLENVYIHELKIIKLKNAKYELYELLDDNWKKMDAIIGDRKVKYKKNTSVTSYNIRDLNKFELNEMYVDLQNLSSSRFHIPEGQISAQTFKEMQKEFNDRFEILNKIEKNVTIDFSIGKLEIPKKLYNKNDKNLNQQLKYKDKWTNEILTEETEYIFALESVYSYNLDCLALKK